MSETNGYAKPEELFSGPPKRTYTNVEIEALGKFCIRTLTTSEGMKLEQGDPETTLLRVIVACCVDPKDKNPIFGDEHVVQLKELPAKDVMALGLACNEYSGLAIKKDAVKNLSETRNGNLPSS